MEKKVGINKLYGKTLNCQKKEFWLILQKIYIYVIFVSSILKPKTPNSNDFLETPLCLNLQCLQCIWPWVLDPSQLQTGTEEWYKAT